jgi:hypothetical protein
MKPLLTTFLSLLILFLLPMGGAWFGPPVQTVPTAPPNATFPPPESDVLGFLTETAQAAPTLPPIASAVHDAPAASSLSGYGYLLLCALVGVLGLAALFFLWSRRLQGEKRMGDAPDTQE